MIQSKLTRPLFKHAFTIVDEKLIRRIVVAHVDVEIAIRVDVHQTGTGAPIIPPSRSGGFGGILKLEIPLIEIEPVSPRPAGEIKILQAIPVQISNGNSATREGPKIEPFRRMFFVDEVYKVDPRFLGREFAEKGFPSF